MSSKIKYEVIQPYVYTAQDIERMALGIHLVPCIEVDKAELLKRYSKANRVSS